MDETTRMYLLEIVFADGESARQHYDTAAQAASA